MGNKQPKKKLNQSHSAMDLHDDDPLQVSNQEVLLTQYQQQDQYVFRYICYIEKRRHIIGLLKIKSAYQRTVAYPYQMRIYDGKTLDVFDELYLDNYLYLYRDVIDIFYNNEVDLLILHLNEYLSIYKWNKEGYNFMQHVTVSKAICSIVEMKPRFMIIKQPLKTRFYYVSKSTNELTKVFSSEQLTEYTLTRSRYQKMFFAYLSYRDEPQKRQVLRFKQFHYFKNDHAISIGSIYSFELGLTLRQSVSKLIIDEYAKDQLLIFFMDDITFIIANLKTKTVKRLGQVRLNLNSHTIPKFNAVGRIFCINGLNFEFGQKRNENAVDSLCYYHKLSIFYRMNFIQINKNYKSTYVDHFLQEKYDEIVARSSFID